MRVGRRILLIAAVAALTSPTAAYARGGGGSHGFSGGGHSSGGGGSHGSGHGGYGGGGGGAVLAVLVLVVLVVVLVMWVKARARKSGPASGLNTSSDRASHRSDAQAHERAAQVEARVDVLGDTDATFELDALKERAVWLYLAAQQAWTDRDHDTLRRILSPVLYGKWSEELDDYRSRGEINVVEVVSGPVVEMIDVANRKGEVNDTVTFRVSATLNDYVRRDDGSRAGRKDGSTNPVEYWTLRKNEAGEWIVASVEQESEGAHHLTNAIETDGWDQRAVAREAVLEVAEKTRATGTSDVLALTTISWSTDADAAAGDLSVLDGRFDRAVLEVGAEQFIEQWVMNDGSLDFTDVRTADRTVLRDASVESVEVRSLVSREPIVFRVAVGAQGVYYEVDRRTEQVLRGDAHRRRSVTLVFNLRLDGPSAQGWTVISAEVQ